MRKTECSAGVGVIPAAPGHADEFFSAVALTVAAADWHVIEQSLASWLVAGSGDTSGVPVLARMLAVRKRCAMSPVDFYRRCRDSRAFQRLIGKTAPATAVWPSEQEFIAALALVNEAPGEAAVLGQWPVGARCESGDVPRAARSDGKDTDPGACWRDRSLRNALECLPFGMLLIRGNGEVSTGNAKGRTLLAQELTCTRGSRGERVRAGSRLAGLLRECRQAAFVLRHHSLDTAGGRTGDDELYVVIEPFGFTAKAHARWQDRRTGFLVFVKRKWDHALPSTILLQEFFGLSKTEARLALSLMLGASIKGYADESCVSISTVRTHLHALFAKTGASCQAELLGILHSLPPGI